jgi:hypothetical protein
MEGEMSTKWQYTVEVVAVALAVIILGATAMNYDPPSEIIFQLETSELLYQKVITVPIGPLIVVGTPFQLVYIILTIGLTFFAILVILAYVLVRRRRSYSPARPARIGV